MQLLPLSWGTGDSARSYKILDIWPELLLLFADHQAKSSSTSCCIVYLARKSMCTEMEVLNGCCDILSGEQRLRCCFRCASNIKAKPDAVNSAVLIVDFFEDCDNMCMTLSCAMNVEELQSNAMEAKCSYQTRFVQNCFRSAFCSHCFPSLCRLEGACGPAASFRHCVVGLSDFLLGVGGQCEA